jgi:hypothetical protein
MAFFLPRPDFEHKKVKPRRKALTITGLSQVR